MTSDGVEIFSKVLQTLACTILFPMIKIFLDTTIVIGVEIWMIARVSWALYSTWETLLSLRYQRSSRFSLFPHVRQSM